MGGAVLLIRPLYFVFTKKNSIFSPPPPVVVVVDVSVADAIQSVALVPVKNDVTSRSSSRGSDPDELPSRYISKSPLKSCAMLSNKSGMPPRTRRSSSAREPKERKKTKNVN